MASEDKPNPDFLSSAEELPKSMNKNTARFLSVTLHIPPGKKLDATRQFSDEKLAALRTRFYVLKRQNLIPDNFAITQREETDGKHLYIINSAKGSKTKER